MKPYIYPYLIGSRGAVELAKVLGTIQIRQNGTYQPRSDHLVFNWGNNNIPKWWGELAAQRTINKPQAVQNATDKIRAFQLFSAQEVPTLVWTTSIDTARSWFDNGPDIKVVCRTLTRASEGRGIVIALRKEEIVYAPLYTLYKKKQFEYRVHAGQGRVFDLQMKRRKKDQPKAEGTNAFIRNTENGWVFCRQGIEVPQECKDAAVKAVQALGLDFGAVDIGYGQQGVAVYEVNTAPGLEGQTCKNYETFFRSLMG